jgi:putative acetyltransferase
VTLAIQREKASTSQAKSLLRARDAESNALYPPESQFHIPLDRHDSDDVVLLVARQNGRAIGCGALQCHASYAELKSIFVIAEERGRGIGRAIIERLEDEAHSLGFEVVKLETGIHSPAAIRTYESAGYERCGRFGSYKDDPLSVYMTKRLPPGDDTVSLGGDTVAAGAATNGIKGERA